MPWVIDPPGGLSNHNFPRRIAETEAEARSIVASYPLHTRIFKEAPIAGASSPDHTAPDRLVPRHTNGGDATSPPYSPPNPPRASASSICRTAASLVSGARSALHGDKLANHQCIARLWDGYLQSLASKRGVGCPFLSATDVAPMMELLKIARRLSGAHNLDDYIDAAGYAAIAGEIAANAEATSPRP